MKLTTRQKDALVHIAENCRKAVELPAELTQEKLVLDWRARYALIRCVEVVGEAVSWLGGEFETAHPQIPWRQIAGMRNRLIHGYDNVDEAILWRTVTDKLPSLLTQVENILAEPE